MSSPCCPDAPGFTYPPRLNASDNIRPLHPTSPTGNRSLGASPHTCSRSWSDNSPHPRPMSQRDNHSLASWAPSRTRYALDWRKPAPRSARRVWSLRASMASLDSVERAYTLRSCAPPSAALLSTRQNSTAGGLDWSWAIVWPEHAAGPAPLVAEPLGHYARRLRPAPALLRPEAAAFADAVRPFACSPVPGRGPSIR